MSQEPAKQVVAVRLAGYDTLPPRASGSAGVKKSESWRFFLTGR